MQLLTLGDIDDECVADWQDDTDELIVTLDVAVVQTDTLPVAESLDVVDTLAHDDIDGDPEFVTLLEEEAEFDTVPEIVTDELGDGDDDPDVDSDGDVDDVAQLLAVWHPVVLTVAVALDDVFVVTVTLPVGDEDEDIE